MRSLVYFCNFVYATTRPKYDILLDNPMGRAQSWALRRDDSVARGRISGSPLAALRLPQVALSLRSSLLRISVLRLARHCRTHRKCHGRRGCGSIVSNIQQMWQILAIVYDSKHLTASFEILNETLTTRLRSIATQSTLNFRLVFQLSVTYDAAPVNSDTKVYHRKNTQKFRKNETGLQCA